MPEAIEMKTVDRTNLSDPKPRAGWAEQLRKMAEAGDEKLLDEWPPTKFDEEEWEW